MFWVYIKVEDNFCNKRVYYMKDSIIKMKSNRYIILKNNKELLNVRMDKSILTHSVSLLRNHLRDRHFKIEYLHR